MNSNYQFNCNGNRYYNNVWQDNKTCSSYNNIHWNNDNYNNHHHYEYFQTLASGGTYSTGIFTGTTPTLTPTTIHNIEQTFFDLQGNNASSTNNAMIPSNLSGLQHYQQPQDLTISRHSGFIPPIVEPINSIIPAMVQIKQEVFDDNSMGSSEQDYFGGASTLGGGSKRQRTHADGSYIVPNIDPNTYLVANSRRPTGPRKMKRVDLTPEEEVKRHQRRERNKWAAAKCRNKREDITNRLINVSI